MGAKIGVLIAVVISLVAVVLLTRWVVRRWRQQRQEKQLDEDEILGTDAIKELFFSKKPARGGGPGRGSRGGQAPGEGHVYSDEAVWIREESRRRYQTQSGLAPSATAAAGARVTAARHPHTFSMRVRLTWSASLTCRRAGGEAPRTAGQIALVVTSPPAAVPEPPPQPQGTAASAAADANSHSEGGSPFAAPGLQLSPDADASQQHQQRFERDLATLSLAAVAAAAAANATGVQYAETSVSTTCSATMLIARDAAGNPLPDAWGPLSSHAGAATGTDVSADGTPTRRDADALNPNTMLTGLYGGGGGDERAGGAAAAAAAGQQWLLQQQRLRQEQQALSRVTRALLPGDPVLEQRLQVSSRESENALAATHRARSHAAATEKAGR